MITCGEPRRASTLSCVPIIITRVLIGNRTSHSSWPPSLRVSWRKCRPITSWTSARGWQRPRPSTCHLRRRLLRADGSLTQSCPCTDEFARTGFQGGLQWYRCVVGKYLPELETFSGRTIDVPACFISGKSDWGVYQLPVALEKMETAAVCTQ